MGENKSNKESSDKIMGQNKTNRKGDSRFAPKLEHEHKELIVLRLAEFVDWTKIIKEIRITYAINVTEHTIDYYARKKDEITKKREALNTHLENIPHANKFIRLRVLNRDIQQLNGKDDLDSLKVKLVYMEQARKEKEGLKIDVTKKESWAPDQFKHLKDPRDLDQAIKEAEKKDEEVVTVAQVLEEK